jgi:endoglycosylceramidase
MTTRGGRRWPRPWHMPRNWPRPIRGCCGCLTTVVCLFLLLSLCLTVFTLIPNSYPAYPASARQLASGGTTSGYGLPWLHSNGDVILDSSGRQVLLRGMNVTGLEEAQDMKPGPVPTAASFAEMEADGFDVIRLPINWSRLEPHPGKFSNSYLDEIRSVVNDAARHGIYTILDLHNIDWSIYYHGDGAPSWATAGSLPRSLSLLPSPWDRHVAPGVLASYGIFWLDLAGWQADVTQVWSFVAHAFRNDSAVAAFDLWNEPHPFPVAPGLFEKKYLDPFEASLITHLATVAPHQIWITEQTLSFGLATYVGKLPYPNQIFSSHVFATLLEPPWQKPTPEYATPLKLLEAQAKDAGGAPWVGEIGADPGKVGNAWVAKEMNELDTYKLGWAFWDWDEGGSWAFVKQPSRLRIVARAYPRGTPGDLQELSYDYQTGRLEVSFRGDAAGKSLQVEVPSFFKTFHISGSDPAGALSSKLDAKTHVLTVTFHDQQLDHKLVFQFSA